MIRLERIKLVKDSLLSKVDYDKALEERMVSPSSETMKQQLDESLSDESPSDESLTKRLKVCSDEPEEEKK